MKAIFILCFCFLTFITGCSLSILSSGSGPFTVAYYGNGNSGGTTPVDPNSYTNGQIVTVLGNTGNLTRTGYIFNCWNTAPDYSGTSVSAGENFIMGTANVSLYAVWTQSSTYMVIYNGNSNTGGTPPVDINNYTNGQNVTVLGNTGNLMRAGYTLTGWNTLPARYRHILSSRHEFQYKFPCNILCAMVIHTCIYCNI